MTAQDETDLPGETAVSAMPQGPAASASLQERLAAVEGFDIDTALRNLGGHLSVLDRVLGVFVQAYGGGQPELLERPSLAKRAAQQVACHSIRGACAMIGAEALMAQAAELERLVVLPGDPPEWPGLALGLHEGLMALAQRIAAAISPR